MVDFLADVRVRVVCGDELAALGDHHRLLANINTPAEYEGLDRTIGHEL
jgi:molybdopterin-guanine dinucleotide biosynthesis protein A